MNSQEFKGFFFTDRKKVELVDGAGKHAGFKAFTSAKLQGTVVTTLEPVSDRNGRKYLSVIIEHEPASRTMLAKFAEGTGLWPKVRELNVGDMIKVVGIQQHGRNSLAPHVSVQAFGELEVITEKAPVVR
jgi:hypothetical protein